MLFRKGCDIMKKYYPRIADKILEEALESAGAVLIEGPKWSGKNMDCCKEIKKCSIHAGSRYKRK